MDPMDAARGLGMLEAAMLASFLAAAALTPLYHRLSRRTYCQVCVSISALWMLNLALGFLPAWATVFLVGQSAAGGAGLARDLLAERLGLHERPEPQRRLAKQLLYFGLLLAATLGAITLLALAEPALLAQR